MQPISLFLCLSKLTNTSAENYSPLKTRAEREVSHQRPSEPPRPFKNYFKYSKETKVQFPSVFFLSTPSATMSSATFTAISLQTYFILSSHHGSSGCGFSRNRKSCAHVVQKDNEHEIEPEPRKRLNSCGCRFNRTPHKDSF